MARRYRTKKLNAARSGLLSALTARAAALSSGAAKPEEKPVERYAKVMRAYFKREKFTVQEKVESDRVLFLGSIAGDMQPVDSFLFRVHVDEDIVQGFYCIPSHCPEKYRGEMARYCNRLSHAVKGMKLVMDEEDGELIVEIDLPVAILTGPQAMEEIDRWLFGVPMAVLSDHVAGIYRVLGGTAAKDAFAACADDHPAWKRSGPTDVAEAEIGESVFPESDFDVFAPAMRKGARACATKNAEYSLDALNVKGDIPLDKVIAALKRKSKKSAAIHKTILLWGPPGSGKSALVKHIGAQLGAPVRVIRSSDLLDHLVGATEKKVHEIFAASQVDGSIIFIDEADALIGNRAAATQTWERSQVGQILTELDSFTGIAFVATNFCEDLDPAIMRRMSLKLELGSLTPSGKRIMFENFFHAKLSASEASRLAEIDLTPGDYRCAREKLFFTCEHATNEDCVAALEAEAARKPKKAGRLGF